LTINQGNGKRIVMSKLFSITGVLAISFAFWYFFGGALILLAGGILVGVLAVSK